MDIQYLLFLQDFRNSIDNALTPFMEGVSMFAVTYLILFPVYYYWNRNKKDGLYALVAYYFCMVITPLVKLTACVYRPWIRDSRIVPAGKAIVTATGYSFPSGLPQRTHDDGGAPGRRDGCKHMERTAAAGGFRSVCRIYRADHVFQKLPGGPYAAGCVRGPRRVCPEPVLHRKAFPVSGRPSGKREPAAPRRLCFLLPRPRIYHDQAVPDGLYGRWQAPCRSAEDDERRIRRYRKDDGIYYRPVCGEDVDPVRGCRGRNETLEKIAGGVGIRVHTTCQDNKSSGLSWGCINY